MEQLFTADLTRVMTAITDQIHSCSTTCAMLLQEKNFMVVTVTALHPIIDYLPLLAHLSAIYSLHIDDAIQSKKEP